MLIVRENWTRVYRVTELDAVKRIARRIGIRQKNVECYRDYDNGNYIIRITGTFNDLELFELSVNQRECVCIELGQVGCPLED